MTFKDCPQCKGRGIVSTTEYGETTFERCPLCKDRETYQKAFNRMAKALKKNDD